MKFQELALFFQKLEQTSSRNAMTEILADLFKKAGTEEIDKICYLTQGRVVPLFIPLEFGMADKMMARAISKAYGISEEKVTKAFKKMGDLGKTAEIFSSGGLTSAEVKPQKETNEVFAVLEKVAKSSGKGSVEQKTSLLADLLKSVDPLSARYIVRIPLGKLRLGFSDMTILDALSWMVAGDKSKREEIERAFNVRVDIGQIAQIVKKEGLEGLKRIKISLRVPIMPALCQRLPTAEEMVEKLAPRQARGKVAVEPKYDGTRLQIHFGQEGFVRIFTRNLENVTSMFPDIIRSVAGEVGAKEAILDGEAIGFDPKSGNFLPFQETIKRKRKYEIDEKAKEIPLKFFCFDILYKDGQDLLATPLNKRREILEKILFSSNKTIVLSPQIVTDDPGELRRYHDEQIEKGLEGVVVKKWQAAYEPGRRGYTWVKFKQEKGKKGGGLADTLDCVVMGYYKGKGKRAGFGIGGFLVGIREKEGDDQFVTISKIGTGLTDEQWRGLKLKIENLKFKIEEKPKEYEVDKNLTPDVWCSPKIVVEIEADNITKSPVHTAKYALRFPRLVRFRDDKSPKEATTLAEAKKLYKLQK
ncbi:ATP-dependent DNA ligase [Candidatus Gottesmanbacteria bacterium]|nr:ATP-dependent DNA ligase [Candidatus Gottesmanbacteria bacterium]